MKILLTTCTALLLVIGLGVTNAHSQICFDFDLYCDGLELSATQGQISGFWRNTDCLGTDVAVSGFIAGGMGYVKCDSNTDPCPGGNTWGFLIDGPLDGTMQMYQYSGGWNIWLDPLDYTNYSGPCQFAPEPGLGPNMATWMPADFDAK